VEKAKNAAAMTCSFIGCDRRGVSLGLCTMHYQRMKRHGDPAFVSRRTNGSGTVSALGYLRIRTNYVTKFAHVMVAEKTLGRPLPDGAKVHHINGNRLDNRHENLLICPDQKYHLLIHKRQDALNECGNPDWRRCLFCKTYDDTMNLSVNKANNAHYHSRCINEAHKKHRAERKVVHCG
jgi:hypothetical protein